MDIEEDDEMEMIRSSGATLSSSDLISLAKSHRDISVFAPTHPSENIRSGTDGTKYRDRAAERRANDEALPLDDELFSVPMNSSVEEDKPRKMEVRSIQDERMNIRTETGRNVAAFLEMSIRKTVQQVKEYVFLDESDTPTVVLGSKKSGVDSMRGELSENIMKEIEDIIRNPTKRKEKHEKEKKELFETAIFSSDVSSETACPSGLGKRVFFFEKKEEEDRELVMPEEDEQIASVLKKGEETSKGIMLRNEDDDGYAECYPGQYDGSGWTAVVSQEGQRKGERNKSSHKSAVRRKRKFERDYQRISNIVGDGTAKRRKQEG